MGTSALEGAKLYIPTILIDASYKKVKGDYLYRLLCDTKNYDLGHIVDKSDILPGNESLKEIILKITRDYKSYSEMTYRYYLENHTIEYVVDKFLVQISHTTLTYNMIDKSYFKKSWSLKIYDGLRPLYKKIKQICKAF
jgi:hypothetical protein